jgi:hypothetical protein
LALGAFFDGEKKAGDTSDDNNGGLGLLRPAEVGSGEVVKTVAGLWWMISRFFPCK